jgi:transcription-repair coupling factor (superfamily II helicase)
MSPQEQILTNIEGGRMFAALRKAIKSRTTVEVTRLAGSAFAVYGAAVVRQRAGVHIYVLPDRDTAAYVYNDLAALLPNEQVLFFPTGYKRSIRFGKPDDSGIVQRTAALNAITAMSRKSRVVLCTYPDALCEKVAARQGLESRTLEIRCGQRIKMLDLEDSLMALGFERVPFVYEPGQYSIRGGIVDIFSFSENRPYRLDFFDDDVDYRSPWLIPLTLEELPWSHEDYVVVIANRQEIEKLIRDDDETVTDYLAQIGPEILRELIAIAEEAGAKTVLARLNRSLAHYEP